MQSICLLFAGRQGLDDPKSREAILRIPEVSRKIKEAQQIMDRNLDPSQHTDLISFIHSSDDEFNGRTSLKSLVAATVQIGLFERFVRYRNRPQFLIGRTNGCSALKVCAGQQSFEDFVISSRFFQENNLMAMLSNQQLTPNKLTGTEFEEYGALTWNSETGQYGNLDVEKRQAVCILEEIVSDHLIGQCIHVGPSVSSLEQQVQDKGLYTLSSMSSIDLDPILNSFWKAG